ncbi:MAG: hypothetical protein IKD07_03115 [Clostridia bacterium]|nr:hypothetical protein [Clostridia bacterium]
MGEKIADGGKMRFCQQYVGGLGKHGGSHKEPMNGAADGNIGSGASSGFA